MPRLRVPDQLRSSKLKLQRARVHISALNRSIKRRSDSNESAVRTREHDIDGVGKSYIVNPDAPVNWGLMAGDTLTNLRASLDHIAWALALKQARALRKTAPDHPTRVQFPIFDCQQEYESRSAERNWMLREVWPASHRVFESLQPYHAADWPETGFLRVLDELVRLDKHRLLTQAVYQASVYPGAVLRPGRNAWDAPVFRSRYELVITKRTVEGMKQHGFEPHLTLHVLFSAEGAAVDGCPVAYLGLIHDFIRDEVVPRFTGFFQ